MDHEDLNDILFTSTTPNSKGQPNLYTSTLSTTFQPIPAQNKSDNKTREDLEALIGGIPFPNDDDLSLTSFNSRNTSNSATPQRQYNDRPFNHISRLPTGTSEERKPPILKTNLKTGSKQGPGYSSDKRTQQNLRSSGGYHNPRQLNFDANMIVEELTGMESLTPSNLKTFVNWSKQHVTPGDSRTLFPQVVAPSIDISGDGSLYQSKNNTKDRHDFSKSSNDNQDLTIDHIHEKEEEPISDRKFNGTGRVLPAVGESRVRIETKRYQDQLAAAEHEMNFQRKKYANLEQESNYLTQRINELEEHVSFLQDKYKDHTSVENLRGRNLANAKTQLKQVKDLLERKEMKVTELSSQIQQLKKNDQIYREAVETELSNLHLEIQREKILSQAHQKRATELEEKMKGSMEQNIMGNQQMNHRIESLSTQIKNQNGEIMNLRNEHENDQTTMSKMAAHINELNELLHKATEQLEDKEREVEELKKYNENFLVEQHKLSNLESDKVWEQKYLALNDELSRIRDIKDREVIKLKEIISQRNQQVKSMEEALMKKDAHLNLSAVQTQGHNNIFDSLLQTDESMTLRSLVPKDDEIKTVKEHYEREIGMYMNHIESMQQKISALENERSCNGFENLPTHTSRYSVNSSCRGDKKVISQSTNCTLYLDLLQELMSSLGIYSAADSDYEEELRKIYEYASELTSKVQSLEKNVVEFKKAQITMSSELNHYKMDNEQLRETLRGTQIKSGENSERVASLHNEIADLKKTIISLEGQTRNGGSPTRSIASRRDDMFRDHEDEITQEHLQLKEDYRALEEENRGSKEIVQKLRARCQELEIELKKKTGQLQNLEDENELLQLEKDTKNSMGKDHLDQMKRSFNEKVRAFEQRSEAFAEGIRQKESENAELKGRLEVVEIEARNSERRVSEDIRRESGENVFNLENTVRELQSKVADRDKEIETLNFRIKEIEYELEQEKAESQANVYRLRDRSESLESDVNSLKEENMSLSEQVNHLSEIIDKRDVELNKLMNDKLAAEAEKEKLILGLDQGRNYEDVVHKLKESLSSRDKRIEEMNEKLQDQQNELKKEKERYHKLKEAEIDKGRQVESTSNLLKEKEKELKFVIESARKKEIEDAKATNELGVKKAELEKLQSVCTQMEKDLATLKKDKAELKKTLDASQQSLEKTEYELKKREETSKQVEDTNKKNTQYLKDKDKANVDLFRVNKSLTETIKTLEEELSTLKTESEKKAKALVQKTNEVKNLTQANKSLEENRQELINQTMELNIKVQQLEHEISTKKMQAVRDSTTLNESQNNFNERYATRETDRNRGSDQEIDSKGKHDMERLLLSFSERQSEFENIKHSFVDKMMSLTEKVASYEQKCLTLMEENTFLTTQMDLYKNANITLNEKTRAIENNLKAMNQWTSLNESNTEFMHKMDIGGDNLSSLRKTHGVMEEFGDEAYDNHVNIEIDELRPPSHYEANPLRYASYSARGEEYEMKSTLQPYDGKATNVFTNNILDMISPEMLSTEETVSLMLEVLRRASQSHKLAIVLGKNREFKELTNTIKKHVTLEERTSQDENSMSFSGKGGKIRRQPRQNENLYTNYE